MQKEFAAADTAKVVALLTAINQAVFAFAPAVLGWLRDVEADYTLPFGIAACLQIAASLLVIGHRIGDRMDRGEPLHRRVAHCPKNCRTALTNAGP